MKLSLHHIEKEYQHPVVRDISYTFEERKLYVIKGVSGSGKSTLLHILAGIETEFKGNITNGYGDQLSPETLREQSSFISQYSLLLSNLTVLENLKLIRNDIDRIHELAKEYCMEDKLLCYPNELSGGERQRISCIRAMLCSPKILFADEPTASLDHRNSEIIAKLLYQMAQTGIIVIVATHEHYFDAVASEILNLKSGELCATKIESAQCENAFSVPQSDEQTCQQQQRLPFHIVIKRYSDSIRFGRVCGYIVMFLLLFMIVILGENLETIMTNYMTKRYPMDAIQMPRSQYSSCSFRESTIPYYYYTAQDNDVTALYLPDYHASVFGVEGMLLYGSFPTDADQVIVSFDYGKEICPSQDEIGCKIEFQGKTYTVSAVLRPLDNTIINDGMTAIDIYNSDIYYFRQYGKIIFIPYQTIKEIGEEVSCDYIRVLYPNLYHNSSDLERVRKEMEGASISIFDSFLQDLGFFTKWISLGLLALFLVCFLISCVFMGAQIGIELFYRKREIGYLQVFGLNRVNISLYLIIGCMLKILLAGIIAYICCLIGIIALHILIGTPLWMNALYCFILMIIVILIYMSMVFIEQRKIIRKNIIDLIT